MRKRVGGILMVSVAVGALLPVLVRAKGTPPRSSVLIPSSEIKLSDVPDMPGAQIATVEGDPRMGPSHFMLKFVSGFSAPLHHHTADHYVTVVAGTLVLTVDGKETRLPRGSFFYFTGKPPHSTRCEKGADCVLSLDVRGKWDVVPEKTMASQ